MPEFVNPFPGNNPDRKLTPRELARALRLGLAAELEAVHLYEAHADATDHPLAKKVLQDIANEEREHAGEFLQLIKMLVEDEASYLEHGAAEVLEMAEEVARGNGEPVNQQPKADDDAEGGDGSSTFTIGSMKE